MAERGVDNINSITKFYQVRKQRIVYTMGGKCALCGYDKNVYALDMHHIDPKEKDFNIADTNKYHTWEELSTEMQKCILLCANCHREVHYSLNQGNKLELRTSYNQERSNEIRNIIIQEKTKIKHFCLDCGNEISRWGQRCQKCAELHNRMVERPSRELFKREIRTIPFTVLSKKYGVSDNAIRKWCDNYHLPRRKSEITSYSDEEWNAV